MALSKATAEKVTQLRHRYPQPRSAVLPSLWAVQEEMGYVTPDGMEEVAHILGLAPSDVQATSTFYSMYFQKEPGRHSVVACTNVSCALRGSDAVVRDLEAQLGCPSGTTSADGVFTWEASVECLGACDVAPAIQIDHVTHGPITTESLTKALTAARSSHGHGPASKKDNGHPMGSQAVAKPTIHEDGTPSEAVVAQGQTPSAESGSTPAAPTSTETFSLEQSGEAPTKRPTRARRARVSKTDL